MKAKPVTYPPVTVTLKDGTKVIVQMDPSIIVESSKHLDKYGNVKKHA
jgi:hypothetical protein